jgi:hypothetical protein
MPNLNMADWKATIRKEHKEQLNAWYQGIWEREKEDVFAEQYKTSFRENLDRMPAAYYYLLENLTRSQYPSGSNKSFDPDELNGALKNLKDYALLVHSFHNKDHRQIQAVMESMVNGNISLRDPNALNERYMSENYRELDTDEIASYGFEIIDESTIAQTPEIKDSPRYSDKYREIAWKKEVARLEKVEKDRVSTLKDDKERSKNYFNLHLRLSQTDGAISQADVKNLNQKYSEYEKENKKLEEAIRSYHKVKLERDKLRAKQDILGKLSSRDAKKLAEYEKKTIKAVADRAAIKDQMLKNFDAKLAKEGQDPHSPHNKLRREQILQDNTRYFPLDNAEQTREVYSFVFEGKEMASRPINEQQHTTPQNSNRKPLDLSNHFNQSPMLVIRDDGPNREQREILKIKDPPILE